jgi:hypothetical protein
MLSDSHVSEPKIIVGLHDKKPELDQIIESCKPTIIFGSETWLSDNISTYEYFDPTKYTVYSKNRKGLVYA